MRIDFERRHVVVTGATGELGEVVVRALIASGATCHLPVRSPDKARKLVEAHGERLHVVVGVDVTDDESVTRFFDGLPGLWASVHAAGGFAAAPVEETSGADFSTMMTMNAYSAFLCCREAARAMRDGGRIVNVAAAAALEPRRGAGMAAYAASKAALAALTVALGEELAPRGIWVNAVVPSIMDTVSNRRAIPDADHEKWPKLDEVAATIAFLASPQNAVTRAALVPVYGKS